MKYPQGAALVAACLLGLAVAMAWAGIVINITPSYPRGLYTGELFQPGRKIKLKDMVLVCPDTANPAIINALKLKIFPVGSCAGGIAPLIKTVEGVPGDYVEREDNMITINGQPFRGCPVMHAHLFPLPVGPGYSHRLGDYEYWLMSDHNPDSFDSRYFGPITKDQIRKILQPLVTE